MSFNVGFEKTAAFKFPNLKQVGSGIKQIGTSIKQSPQFIYSAEKAKAAAGAIKQAPQQIGSAVKQKTQQIGTAIKQAPERASNMYGEMKGSFKKSLNDFSAKRKEDAAKRLISERRGFEKGFGKTQAREDAMKKHYVEKAQSRKKGKLTKAERMEAEQKGLAQAKKRQAIRESRDPSTLIERGKKQQAAIREGQKNFAQKHPLITAAGGVYLGSKLMGSGEQPPPPPPPQIVQY